jgi:hypothetical protein
MQNFRERSRPGNDWGPALPKHRESAYIPGIINSEEETKITRTAQWVAKGTSIVLEIDCALNTKREILKQQAASLWASRNSPGFSTRTPASLCMPQRQRGLNGSEIKVYMHILIFIEPVSYAK